jgi:hypothetical protein
MSANATWPLLALLALGAWHGMNPGMGWLFAVALGLQEQRRRAVWRALLPLAAGHALAVGAALGVAFMLGTVVPGAVLKWIVAVTLVVFGAVRLLRNHHPRYGGMRMTMRTLTVWSFLMASAHGAGLMVLPFVVKGRGSGTGARSAATARGRFDVVIPMSDGTGIGSHDAGPATSVSRSPAPGTGSATARSHPGHSASTAPPVMGNPIGGMTVLIAHTLGFLFATGLIAVIVYEKLGLKLLRRLWVNLDVVWGIVLIATGLLTPVIS